MDTNRKPLWTQAWLLFLSLAIVIFVVPALLGHPFASGDNLIQFNPLRVLAGRIEKRGQLPLWNQFIWSGTPLLAGFNAGVFFPTSWLYTFLPAQFAWGINQAVPYFLGGYGFYLLMKETRVSEFSSKLTGLLFAYSGEMIGQGVHLDMVIGISLAPWLLLCASRLIERPPEQRLRYASYLSICYALIVLAGAPEAMLDELVVVLVFVVVKLWKSRIEWSKKLLWMAGSGAGALGLSAAQWVPGLAYQRISQRTGLTFAFVTYGQFAPQYFYTLVAPYLFGGPGAFNIPTYFGPFNWEETVIYPTISPVIALLATLNQVRKRIITSELTPYLFIAIVGTVLALGTYTPLEYLLVHVPLYGQQRLAGRNMLAFDLAVYAIFGIWLDRALIKYEVKERVVGWVAFAPAAAIAVLFAGFFLAGSFLIRFFHASARPNPMANYLELKTFSVQIVVALLSGSLYFFIRHIHIDRVKYAIVSVALVDLISFNIFGTLGTPSYLNQFDSTTSQMKYLHTLIGDNGRFAIYDPNLFTYYNLNNFGEPDLNIGADNHSIQGYSSLSLKTYEQKTKSHAQGSLSTNLIAGNLIDALETRTILTNWHYFMSRYGTPTPVPLPFFYFSDPSPTTIAPAPNAYPSFKTQMLNQEPTVTTGFFGMPLSVSELDINLGNTFNQNSVDRVGLLSSSGTTTWLSPIKSPTLLQESSPTPSNLILRYGLTSANSSVSSNSLVPITAIGVVVDQELPVNLSDPQKALLVGVGVQSSSGYFALNGQLSSYLTYPHYRFVNKSQNITIFSNTRAKPAIQIANKNAAILNQELDLNGSLKLTIKSPQPTSMTWSEAYAPGWRIEYTSVGSARHFSRPVEAKGVIQQIPIPKGTWNLNIFYHPSSVYRGITITSGALIALLALLIVDQTKSKQSKRFENPNKAHKTVG